MQGRRGNTHTTHSHIVFRYSDTTIAAKTAFGVWSYNPSVTISLYSFSFFNLGIILFHHPLNTMVDNQP